MTELQMIATTIGFIVVLYTVGLWLIKKALRSERKLIDQILREQSGQ